MWKWNKHKVSLLPFLVCKLIHVSLVHMELLSWWECMVYPNTEDWHPSEVYVGNPAPEFINGVFILRKKWQLLQHSQECGLRILFSSWMLTGCYMCCLSPSCKGEGITNRSQHIFLPNLNWVLEFFSIKQGLFSHPPGNWATPTCWSHTFRALSKKKL